MRIAKIKTTNSSPEELEKRYQEAMLGPQAGMPRFFRDER